MRRAFPIIIFGTLLFALLVDFVPGLRLPSLGADSGDRAIETKLGLDLQGGLRLEYLVKPVTQDDGTVRQPRPEDLAVIGYDNSSTAALGLVNLASIDQSGRELGQTATRTLLSRIEGRSEAVHILQMPSLVARRSLIVNRL